MKVSYPQKLSYHLLYDGTGILAPKYQNHPRRILCLLLFGTRTGPVSGRLSLPGETHSLGLEKEIERSIETESVRVTDRRISSTGFPTGNCHQTYSTERHVILSFYYISATIIYLCRPKHNLSCRFYTTLAQATVPISPKKSTRRLIAKSSRSTKFSVLKRN